MKLFFGLQEKQVNDAWTKYKLSKGLVFKTRKEELDAQNIFLSGMHFAMVEFGEFLRAVEALDCDEKGRWIN